jgi:hypothetical protein
MPSSNVTLTQNTVASFGTSTDSMSFANGTESVSYTRFSQTASNEAVKTSSARAALRPKPFHFTESRRPSRAVENSGKAGFPNAK